MQKHSKIRNVPFPRPCGATGNDAQKLHALTFAHFRGAVLMHEVLYPERSESPVDLPSANGLQIRHKQMGLLENALSLRTSAHAGVAIPRIFKHLGRKTKLFPSNRGAATPVTSVTGSQRHTFLTAPFLVFVSYSFFSGSWLITTAAKTSTQPSSSALVMVSWSSSQPKRAAKTDSRLMSRAAALGATRFWPTICRV